MSKKKPDEARTERSVVTIYYSCLTNHVIVKKPFFLVDLHVLVLGMSTSGARAPSFFFFWGGGVGSLATFAISGYATAFLFFNGNFGKTHQATRTNALILGLCTILCSPSQAFMCDRVLTAAKPSIQACACVTESIKWCKGVLKTVQYATTKKERGGGGGGSARPVCSARSASHLEPGLFLVNLLAGHRFRCRSAFDSKCLSQARET